MRHFITQDATKLGIDLLVIWTMTDTADVEVGAITNVKLVFLRPADEVVIAVFGFHTMQ